MKGFLGLTLLPLLAAGSPVFVDTIHNEAAPIISSTNANEIPDSYMVVFKKHVSQKGALQHQAWVDDVHLSSTLRKQELRKRGLTLEDAINYTGLKHTYNIAGSVMGYAGHFDPEVIEQVRMHPDVSYT